MTSSACVRDRGIMVHSNHAVWRDGLAPLVHAMLARFAAEVCRVAGYEKFAGIELVEISPPWPGGMTANLGAALAQNALLALQSDGASSFKLPAAPSGSGRRSAGCW